MSFAINEDRLAKDIGIARKLLAELRKKAVRGIDYDVVDRKITYSKDGALKMAKLCGVKDVSPAEVEKTIPGKPAIITQVYVKNKKYMEAEKDGHKITIRVRENTRFIPGMEIEAGKLVLASGTLWDFIGRLPRARGTW
jgi:hypothetical protein